MRTCVGAAVRVYAPSSLRRAALLAVCIVRRGYGGVWRFSPVCVYIIFICHGQRAAVPGFVCCCCCCYFFLSSSSLGWFVVTQFVVYFVLNSCDFGGNTTGAHFSWYERCGHIYTVHTHHVAYMQCIYVLYMEIEKECVCAK